MLLLFCLSKVLFDSFFSVVEELVSSGEKVQEKPSTLQQTKDDPGMYCV